MGFRGRPKAALVAFLLPLGLGCTGSIGDNPEGNGGDGDCVGCDPETVAALSIVSTRFPRLTHAEWENTIVDLFQLSAPTGLSSSFAGDTLGGEFENNQSTMVVSPSLWADYQIAAEEVATLVTEDPTLLAGIVPSDLPADPGEAARAFIEQFGKRAYRRPLTSDEVDAYVGQFDGAVDLYATGDAFTRGVRFTIQAMLQSPFFIYRVEAGSEIVDHLIPLSDYEVAAKLSYMLWGTMPDSELFSAADAGELTEAPGIMAQAQRMLDHPRARGMVGSFHYQLYEYKHYEDVAKDPELFPDFPLDIADSLKTEAAMFVEDIIFEEQAGLAELLTSPFTYVNADLAELYGLEGDFDETFVRVELDPAERAGLLTRLGFLTANATAREQHSIFRGVFINRRILCAPLPAPPDDFPPAPQGEWLTNRERIEAYTGKGTCGETCHGTYINPAGFAFENYNAVGAYQTTENGAPVNAADEYPFMEEGTVAYDGPIEFSNLLAEAGQSHSCYARFWLEFAYGRSAQKGDDIAIEALRETSIQGNVKDLIVALTQTKAFRTRAPVEETEQ